MGYANYMFQLHVPTGFSREESRCFGEKNDMTPTQRNAWFSLYEVILMTTVGYTSNEKDMKGYVGGNTNRFWKHLITIHLLQINDVMEYDFPTILKLFHSYIGLWYYQQESVCTTRKGQNMSPSFTHIPPPGQNLFSSGTPNWSSWRPLGNVTLWKFWINIVPKTKVFKPCGKLTSSKLWLKLLPQPGSADVINWKNPPRC